MTGVLIKKEKLGHRNRHGQGEDDVETQGECHLLAKGYWGYRRLGERHGADSPS